MALFYWPGLKLPQSDVLQVKKHPHQSIFHLISTSLKIIVFLDLQINTTFSTIGFIAARHCQPPVWTIMTIYLFVIIYHLFIAALHCQPPVWTIWSELQRQVWLWGEYREYCEYSLSPVITFTFILFLILLNSVLKRTLVKVSKWLKNTFATREFPTLLFCIYHPNRTTRELQPLLCGYL